MSTSNTHPLYAGNDADFCRAMGWHPGTRLVGDEGYGPTVIKITALGEKAILAKTISQGGEICPRGDSESLWTLACRNWTVYGKDNGQ